MADPIVFISRSRLKEGGADAIRALTSATMPQLERDKPRTVFFRGYFNDDFSEVTFLHVFPDAAAMDEHFVGAAQRAQESYRHMEPLAFTIYGTPSEGALAVLRQAAAAGPRLTVEPHDLGGFIRLSEG